ncbi:MAG: SO2930 family diheme c-type cytochrome [Parvibaculum sp.]
MGMAWRGRTCVLTVMGLALCWAGQAAAVNLDVALAEKPAANLSDYGLFDNPGALVPASGVVPYNLITPLFTDYAIKRRFIFVPEGEIAAFRGAGLPDFPVGTILVKTFAYEAGDGMPNDDGSEDLRLIETRLLIHQQGGWIALPYVWNADQTDAVLKRAGARINVTATRDDGRQEDIRYVVPNVNQCKGCHVSDGAMTPIGPKVRNLNHDFVYETGVENQLAHWVQAGVLSALPGAPETLPRIADWQDEDTASLEERARAYLDVNCAHCHIPSGPGKTSGLFLTWEETDRTHLGVLKRPIAAGRGSGGLEYDILPGDADASILHFRMNSVDPGIMMPETGRTLIHEEGVALIRAWINGLEE